MAILPQYSAAVHPATDDANPNPNSVPTVNWCCVISSTIVFSCLCYLLVLGLTWKIKDPEIRLNSLSLSNFDVSSTTVSGNWTASFTVVNPNNKWEVSHTRLIALVYYRKVMVAITSHIAPVVQVTRSTANVTVAFLALSPFPEEPVLERIGRDRSRGEMHFDVEIHTNARFKARGWSEHRRLQYGVYCSDLQVEISSNSSGGEFTRGPCYCEVVCLK